MNKVELQEVVSRLEALEALAKLFNNLWFDQIKKNIHDEKVQAYLLVFEDAFPHMNHVIEFVRRSAGVLSESSTTDQWDKLHGEFESLRGLLQGTADALPVSEPASMLPQDQEALESVGQSDLDTLFDDSTPSEEGDIDTLFEAGSGSTETVQAIDELFEEDEEDDEEFELKEEIELEEEDEEEVELDGLFEEEEEEEDVEGAGISEDEMSALLDEEDSAGEDGDGEEAAAEENEDTGDSDSEDDEESISQDEIDKLFG